MKVLLVLVCLAIEMLMIQCINRIRKNEDQVIAGTQSGQVLGIIIVSLYLLSILIDNSIVVSLCSSIMFLCSDYILYIFNEITKKYIKIKYEWKPIKTVLKILIAIDTVILLINPINQWAVSFERISFGNSWIYAYNMQPMYHLHLILVYGILFGISLMFIQKTLMTSTVYRMKYIPALVTLVIGAIINTCIFLLDGKIPDITILSYGFLAVMFYFLLFSYTPSRLERMAKSLMVNRAESPFIIFDQDGKLISANEATNKCFKNVIDLPEASDRHYWVNRFDLVTCKSENQKGVGKEINGRYYEIRMMEIYDKENIYVGDYIRFIDVTTAKKNRVEQWKLISKDHLTGIYNRNIFMEKTEEFLHKHLNEELIICVIDIEHFKIVNEVFGSKKADEILKGIAEVLRNNFFDIGTFGRIQADHFGLCLKKEDFNPTALLDSLYNDTKYNLNEKFRYLLGIYEVTNYNEKCEKVIEWCSMALDSIKGKYNKSFIYFDKEIRDKIVRKQTIIAEMESALEDNQFEVYYQPQFNHGDGTMVGAEALVRWNHPTWGMISPGEFIPIFEENGFVSKVDLFVWEDACKTIKKSIDAGIDIERASVSVNISKIDFYNLDVVNTLITLVNKYNIPLTALRIEVTESAYVDGFDTIVSVVKQLKNKGFIVEMDDFGSGYSSLNALKDIPVDILKMDMVFLSHTENNERAGSILHSIIRMARWLNLEVIAEGVETKEQADYLTSIGCNVIQGYFYSKPVNYDTYALLLGKNVDVKQHHEIQTLTQQEYDELWNVDSEYSRFFDNYLGSAAIMEYRKGEIECTRTNDRLTGYMSANTDDIVKAQKYPLENLVDGYKEVYINMIEDCIKLMNPVKSLTKWKSNKGEIYIHSESQVIARRRDSYMILVRFSDVTELVEESKERELIIQNEKKEM